MGFNYVTDECPSESRYHIAVTMMLVFFLGMVLVPLVGIALFGGIGWLVSATTATCLKLAGASLILTVPCAVWLHGMAKVTTAIVYEASYGTPPAWY